jgi:hypothetical protein
MKAIKLSDDAKLNLNGKRIIAVGDDYITLDDGCRIYLDESEIDMLGSEPIETKHKQNNP